MGKSVGLNCYHDALIHSFIGRQDKRSSCNNLVWGVGREGFSKITTMY